MEQLRDGRQRTLGLSRFWRLVVVACALLTCLGWVGTYSVSAQGGVYVVRAGDSLIKIAARHGVSASQLAAANGLQWNSWVYVGQRLKIPGQGSVPAAPVSGTGTYVVRAGDTLISIAARHGLTVSQLAAMNGLGANAWVYVGQRLKVSGSASTPAQPTQPAPAASGTYIVRPGDTLIGIALRHGITASKLAAANGLYVTSWVYSGQQLKIPGTGSSPAAPAPATGGTYVVRPGDTLIGIAARHGVSVSRLAAANGLYVSAWVYTGQRLKIPGQGSTPVTPNPPSTAPQPSGSGKWIDVNLTTQTLTAFEGQTAAFTTRVSTGIWRYPTVVGTFQVYVKYAATRMVGPGYNLPNVPWTMYFYRGYAIHGTYWHNNFGTPMSHGCVNLSIPDAKWVYDWSPMGIKVVTHY